jgi:hypothetical protein
MAVLPAPMTTTLSPTPTGVSIGELVAAHQVDAGQELVGRKDLAGELAGDAEEGGAPAPAPMNTASKPISPQLVDGEGLADHLVGLELHAERGAAAPRAR